jgi:hypothetical protein
VGALAFDFYPIVLVLVVIDRESIRFTPVVYLEPLGDEYRDPLLKLDGEDVELVVATQETVESDGRTLDVHTYEPITCALGPHPEFEVALAIWRQGTPDVRLACDVVSSNPEFTCITLVQVGIIPVRVCHVSARTLP